MRTISSTAQTEAYAVEPFRLLNGPEVVQAYVVLKIEQHEPGGLKVAVARSLAQAEELIAQLQAAVAEARAMPLPPPPETKVDAEQDPPVA